MMVSARIFGVLLVLAIGALAKWSDPVELYTDERAIELHTLYTDPLTGISHIWWSIYWESPTVYYAQVSSEGQTLFQTQIDVPNMVLFDGGKMVGLGNGKDLYVMLLGGRRCRGGLFPSLCTEPLFSESKDGGRTWSPFAPIQRPDMSDKCDRDSYSLVVMPNTGRIFIFYSLTCDAAAKDLKGPRRMCYVTRPSQSNTFEKERIIYEFDERETSTGPLADYTFSNGLPIIHLFWQRKMVGQQMMYANSKNLGLTWSAPVELGEHGEKMLLHDMASISGPYPFVAGTYSDFDMPTKMWYSKDHGRTLDIKEISEARGTKYMSDYSKDTAMAVCGTKESPTLLVLSQSNDLCLTYSSWDIKTMEATVGEAPFGSFTSQDGVGVSCYNANGNMVVTAAVSVRIDDIWRIQFSREINEL